MRQVGDLIYTTQIASTLKVAGYVDLEPTLDNLKACFLDYVDCGYWHNLNYDDAAADIDDGSITINDMIKALNS